MSCGALLTKVYLLMSCIFTVRHTFVLLQIRGMHTLIRDANTSKHDFVFYSDRLIRLVLSFFFVISAFHHECLSSLSFQVVEHGLGHLPFIEKHVITPTGRYLMP